MRADLRRDASNIWVIDCSPEGHQPPVSSRVFQDVQQPVCIVLAARPDKTDPKTPARVRFRSLPEGRREDKFTGLATIRLDDNDWQDCATDWRAPFLPAAAASWASYPALEGLFSYDGSGVMPGRTWVIAPDRGSLAQRWKTLVAEKNIEQKSILFHPHEGGDRDLDKVPGDGLMGHEFRDYSVGFDKGDVIAPARYGFRSFDRQWIIPDKRLINRPNPQLWHTHSTRQVYATASHDRTPTGGAALTICAHTPDLHHYHGRGGRAYPLWADREATQPNIRPALLDNVAKWLGQPVSAEDMFAYIAAVAAHPAYTARFAVNLKQPGLRIPITGDAALFAEVINVGCEVVWLHTFGERFVDAAVGRPAGAPRMAKGGPTIPKGGAIPTDAERMPEDMTYDAAEQRLHVGEGHVDNVSKQMWDYEVSGMNVLRQWFSYRKKDRSRPIIGDRRPPSPLGNIQPDGWLPEYTSDLIDVLHVLGRLIALEMLQADLLERIVSGPMLGVDKLRSATVES